MMQIPKQKPCLECNKKIDLGQEVLVSIPYGGELYWLCHKCQKSWEILEDNLMIAGIYLVGTLRSNEKAGDKPHYQDREFE